MTNHDNTSPSNDLAPGDEHGSFIAGLTTNIVGLLLALLLTALSFWVARSDVLWPSGIPVGLAVLAIAQIGVHLVFFLHIGTGPDSTNNVLALAFGILIVFLIMAGSLWIMSNLNVNMIPMDHMVQP
ncbi:cytochrome o ubiquinol oxidase subunit IV [Rhizobium sp. S152]|uniref:cytochrome o ubiquinol oxidase subunit IV n=1 Tax=Rhizobium sp. S152 TaxID=3055038 RepID=UPI0025A99806|nr:cytochrome o ubiquinol oxidase subunit IV [Rhizobium sp. S152]MDM9627807.1 cytochrome o ubiquinol oxidase subunit IV [Rhizobium sp. S152]